MPLVSINRPGILVRLVSDEVKRIDKHTADNIARINEHFWELPSAYQTFTHGVQQEIPNPFYPSLPTGFMVTGAYDSTGIAIPAPAVSFTPFTRSGFFGLTATFAPPNGVVSLYKNSNQAVTASTITAATWDAETAVVGSLAHSTASNTSQIVCSEAGFVEVVYMASFASNGVGGRSAWTTRNGDSTAVNRRKGQQIIPTYAAFNASLSGSCIWDVAANDYIELYVYHDSTTSPLNLLGGGQENSSIQARYVAPPSGYSGTVTGYLLGP